MVEKTEKVVIDPETALVRLRELVAETGDGYTYNPPTSNGVCKYVTAFGPSCGVGKVLFSFGATMAELRELDKEVVHAGTGAHSLYQFSFEALEVTEQACNVLAAFQEMQDTGVAWTHALGSAEGTFSDMMRPEETGM